MFYEIHVSLNHRQFFTTARIPTPTRTREVFSALCARFSPEDGYKVWIARVITGIEPCDPDTLPAN